MCAEAPHANALSGLTDGLAPTGLVRECHVLISCGRRKLDQPAKARDLYVSPLFRRSVALAQAMRLEYSILSAKHGIVPSGDVLEPYDTTLKGAARAWKNEWAVRVHDQIRSRFRCKTRFIVLAGADYYEPLRDMDNDKFHEFVSPLSGLSIGRRLSYINASLRRQKRHDDICRSYAAFNALKKAYGLRSLRDTMQAVLPPQGVYFFFDPGEATNHSKDLPRLVRVGTHGVSAGSSATLRNRLRTHLGTRLGLGNHRSSVFRLHVGQSIIERDSLQSDFPDWGKNQSASAAILKRETELEAIVSRYISNLLVLYVPISGQSAANNMRATIERQFLSLYTEDLLALEEPSATWLGRHSNKIAIRTTGLWNVRDVGRSYDPRFLDFIEQKIKKIATGPI